MPFARTVLACGDLVGWFRLEEIHSLSQICKRSLRLRKRNSSPALCSQRIKSINGAMARLHDPSLPSPMNGDASNPVANP